MVFDTGSSFFGLVTAPANSAVVQQALVKMGKDGYVPPTAPLGTHQRTGESAPVPEPSSTFTNFACPHRRVSGPRPFAPTLTSLHPQPLRTVTMGKDGKVPPTAFTRTMAMGKDGQVRPLMRRRVEAARVACALWGLAEAGMPGVWVLRLARLPRPVTPLQECMAALPRYRPTPLIVCCLREVCLCLTCDAMAGAQHGEVELPNLK